MPDNGYYTISVNQQTNQVYTNLRTSRPNSNQQNNSLLRSHNDPNQQQAPPRTMVQTIQLPVATSNRAMNPNNPKNIQILQNIAVARSAQPILPIAPIAPPQPPPPIPTSTRNGGVRRTKRVIQGTIMGTQRQLNMASQLMSTMIPNGQFVVATPQRTSIQAVPNTQIAIGHPFHPPALPAPVVMQGNLETNNLKDYPEYTFTMHGFSNEHKNMMSEMEKFIHDSYHVLIPSSAYMLMIIVDYTTCSCVEVEVNIFGVFVCKLIVHIVESRLIPFTLEIKCAPKNWSTSLKKSIVVGNHNYLTAAKKVAQSLGNRESYPPESTLPEQLDLKFTIRRGIIRIRFHVGSESADTMFTNICKRILYLTKTKVQPIDKETQTDCSSMTPARFIGLHDMQLQLASSYQIKQSARYSAIFAHADYHEEMTKGHTDYHAVLGNVLQLFKELHRNKSKKSTCSQSVQTCNVPDTKNTTHNWPVFDIYNTIMRNIITYSTRHYKNLQIGIEKLERVNRQMKMELGQKRYEEKLNQEKNNKKNNYSPRHRNYIKKPHEIGLDKGNYSKIHLGMLKYMTEYERTLSTLKFPNVELGKINPVENSNNMILCPADFDGLLNMNDCGVVTLDALDNLLEFCGLDDSNSN